MGLAWERQFHQLVADAADVAWSHSCRIWPSRLRVIFVRGTETAWGIISTLADGQPLPPGAEYLDPCAVPPGTRDQMRAC